MLYFTLHSNITMIERFIVTHLGSLRFHGKLLHNITCYTFVQYMMYMMQNIHTIHFTYYFTSRITFCDTYPLEILLVANPPKF